MQRKHYDAAIAHLQKDVRLGAFQLQSRKPPFKRSAPFEALLRAIIYQQLSGKAAGSILKKFLLHFAGKYPTPNEVLSLSDTQFKDSGVSAQKASYLRDLARRFLDGTIDPSRFSKMTDEEIREHLVVVKGVGRWTADMFLMHTLYRPDVLPTGDLGIQKGFQKVFKMRSLPNAKKMEKLAREWQPYRTVACWYLWEIADTPESKDGVTVSRSSDVE